ncbi:glycerophosphoryl diester phosphodiesterase membrane domain-containing protein [Xylanimonas protaetiae]|uniref:Glycerophosphoryl diester phosphodiesterase membrane domain-containing protein n=1 Tax=Xylanimonas protaetiae TaxID=2509457 RepID=A0A4P6F3U7_9MICO|nr:glycerophosphoryl diester phosphodiesterase membrane domain-containing protein [Xylanimonas protaetiae]QAY68869.1 hypothetical protein ET471_01430 [Xylanimonas protaetiae]
MSTPEQPGPDRPDTTPPVPPVDPVAPVPPPSSGWGETPRYGQYGQPQYGQQPRYGHPGPVPPQPAPTPYGSLPGAPYRPAAVKPGIVPLRPLTLGEIYDGAFSAVRHNPAVMLGLATLVLLVATVVGVLVGQLLVPAFTGVLGPLFDDPELRDAGASFGFTAGSMAQIYGSASGLGLTTLLAGPVVNGVLTVSISRSVLGDKATVRQVWARVAPRAWVLIGWSLLQALGLLVVGLVLVLAVVAIVVAVSQVSGGAAALVGIVLGLGALAVLLWLFVRLLLVPPALALEGARLGATVRRAWLLTRGSFWRTLGIYLLASIIVGFIAQVISVPVSFVAGAFGAADPGATMGAALVLSIVVGVVTAAIQTIFLAGVTALLYIDLRMRREGLDVQLTAAAAERG